MVWLQVQFTPLANAWVFKGVSEVGSDHSPFVGDACWAEPERNVSHSGGLPAPASWRKAMILAGRWEGREIGSLLKIFLKTVFVL